MSMLERISTGPNERRRTRERRKLQRSNARGAGLSISHERGIDAALCSDVTAGGIRLTLDRPPAVGEIVKLNLGPDLVLNGRVAWVDKADCGIEFEQAVDSAVIDLPPVSDRRDRTRAVGKVGSRFREGLSVTVVLPDCERKAVLHWTDDHSASFTLKA
jgi:hypothetical protein